MNYIISIIFLVLAFVVINKSIIFKTKAIPKLWTNLAFGVKILAAIAMLFIYSRSESIKSNADIFRFYDDAQIIYSSLENGDISSYAKLMTGIDSNSEELSKYYSEINNFEHSNKITTTNNKFIIRYIAFLSIFTFGTYGGILLITLFLSFTGLFWLFMFFYSKLRSLKWPLFFIIFFTPSIVFWSSGILKESILLFAISLIINCGNYALQGKKTIPRIFIILISLIVIYQIKSFALFVIIPPMLAYLWLHFFPLQRTMIPYFMMVFIAISFASESDKYLGVGVFDILQQKQWQLTELAIADNSGSLISPILFQPTAVSIATNSPIAIINTLFRPMLWEANSLMTIVAAMENTLFLILILLLIIFPRKDVENPSLVWFTLVFSISFFVVIGLATPVLGALSRYRIPGLIFFLIGVLQLLDIKLIKEKLFSKNTNIIK